MRCVGCWEDESDTVWRGYSLCDDCIDLATELGSVLSPEQMLDVIHLFDEGALDPGAERSLRALLLPDFAEQKALEVFASHRARLLRAEEADGDRDALVAAEAAVGQRPA